MSIWRSESEIGLVVGKLVKPDEFSCPADVVAKEHSHVVKAVVGVFGHALYSIIKRKAQSLCVACYMMKSGDADYPACIGGSHTEHICEKPAGEIFETRLHLLVPDMKYENEQLLCALIYALDADVHVGKFTSMVWLRKSVGEIIRDTRFELVAFLNRNYPNPLFTR